jgi:hypothetical protein
VKILKIDGVFTNWRVQIQEFFYDVFSDPVTGEQLERPESQNDRNTGRTIT